MQTHTKHIRLVSGYMSDAFDDPDALTERVKQLLKGTRYDTIVGTGLSGTLVVPYVARKLHKHWLIVRKPNDGSHSSFKAEGELGQRWVFLDDFVDTGETRDRCRNVVESVVRDQRSFRSELEDFNTTFVGTCSYNHGSFCDAHGRYKRDLYADEDA